MTKRQKRGCALILAGLVMVFGAMFLHVAEEKQDTLAGANSQILLRQLKLNRITVDTVTDQTVPEAAPEEEPAIVDTTMPEKEYLGYSMIGTLRIPSVGMELPILSSWSYPLLNVAPCRYSGSIPGGDMILMGHKYKSHFAPLHSVSNGDSVEFEDVNGIIYRYTVEEILYLHRSEGEQLPSEYPLTLFTCTPGGVNRIVLRCIEAEES